MKRIFILFMIAAFSFGCCSESLSPVDYADPMIGTGFHGHTYPGASAPYGMVQLSPDTRTVGWDACAGYHYDDTAIIGFSHTHLSGTGCADLLDILVSPYNYVPEIIDSLFVINPHPFSHKDENASCGYYSVNFSEEDILVELTATARVGVHRYTFGSDGTHYLLIDMNHSSDGVNVDMKDLQILPDGELGGMRRTQGWVADRYVYFNARFSEPFSDVRILPGGQALVSFPGEVQSVDMAVGLSSVSMENARENSLKEVPVVDFDKVHSEAVSKWASALGKMTVAGGGGKEKVNFYTAAYHAMLVPNVMNDVNGQYRRHDGSIATVPQGKTYYSTLSLWDTFRAWHPLKTLTDTALVNNIIFSMLDMYECTGELPIWPLASGETGTMIGYHSVSVIADAYLAGIGDFDAENALEAMVQSSDINEKGSALYTKYGYVPSDIKRESVSLTLEYAYDDWCIARMAEALGKDEIAAEYYERASNYVNVFDGSTLFFRGRNSDGSWTHPFEIFSTGRDYTEATPWHYRFFVPHDVNGMVQLFGGEEHFIKALDDLFSVESEDLFLGVGDVSGLKGQYAHGNEPSHHMAYLYSYVGKPWKTQELTRELLDEMYSPAPEGIIGNEDCGQMSAWYLLSSAGFYPVCPASGQYILTTPQFDETEILLANGKSLKITADKPGRNHYISEVILNGKTLDAVCITYEQLMQGGELHFVLSDTPASDKVLSLPYSMTDGETVSMPYTTSQVNLFEDALELDLASATPGAEIRYTIDGNEPDSTSAVYEAPVFIDRTCSIKARAFRDGFTPSRTLVLNAVKARHHRSLQINSESLQNGVRYSFHEGEFSDADEMAATAAVSTGTMPAPSIDDSPCEDHFGYVFSGYIDIPARGVWEFTTISDDGSILYIDGVKTVDNNGSHAAVSATGRIALEKGLHQFRLLYFEDYEGQSLAWGWRAPGEIEFSDIPEDRLYYR